ncbi:MAG: hypothetical protein QOC77_2160 [Thermoleophilaceae bacterium]|nr:hypothetical protein [Thermoleophilaceae bacterium]
MSSPAEVQMTIAMPGDWVEVDLRASDEEMVRNVDERAQQIPELRDSRDQAIRLMRQVRDVSEEVGIVFAAAMFDVVEGVPVVASATVTAGPLIGIDAAASEEDRLESIAAALRANSERVEDISVADLPPGRAVRIQQLHEGAESPLGGSLVTFSVQYLLPVAGEDTLVAITFATPTVALAEGFIPLFDTIAATLEIESAA